MVAGWTAGPSLYQSSYFCVYFKTSITKCLKPQKDGVSEMGWPDLQREVSSGAEAEPWAFKGMGAEASELPRAAGQAGPGGPRRRGRAEGPQASADPQVPPECLQRSLSRLERLITYYHFAVSSALVPPTFSTSRSCRSVTGTQQKFPF